ncbi:uncharacterized protein LOC115084693 isoform X3 [Rhinatrema bivittatum]|uniref:uncharacterized protein LOC115084693 isoform X3 n=1 Tax=Rhinatrema bivittatum TaxID=194408 RepID=UPI00112DACAD|nr:uncharacterized protein LOC115084693 isoform X3 [Rhinatrema bivittatum]
MTFLTIIIQMKTKKILKGQISKRKRKDSDILTEREPKEDQEQPKKSDERPYKKPKDKHNNHENDTKEPISKRKNCENLRERGLVYSDTVEKE